MKRYDGLEPILRAYKADLQGILDAGDLKFLLAYCEGFETIGPVFAYLWLDRFGDLLNGSNPTVESLWKWHWCEEYEHRSVVFDTFHRLYGNSWLYRMKAMRFTLKHIRSHGFKLTEKMLEADRAAMDPATRETSVKTMMKIRQRIGRMARFHLLPVYNPFYNPRQRRKPAGYHAFINSLALIESRERQPA